MNKLIISLYVNGAKIIELWQRGTLGIRNPVEKRYIEEIELPLRNIFSVV